MLFFKGCVTQELIHSIMSHKFFLLFVQIKRFDFYAALRDDSYALIKRYCKLQSSPVVEPIFEAFIVNFF